MDYIATKTGNKLVRKAEQFWIGGKFFSGLVDEEAMALYQDPEDPIKGLPPDPDLIQRIEDGS